MKNARRKLVWVCACGLSALGVGGTVGYTRSVRQKMLTDMTRQIDLTEGEADDLTPAQEARRDQARAERYQQIQRLRQLGQTREMERACLKALQDEAPGLRRKAVEFLGRMESARAEEPLAKMAAQMSERDIQNWIARRSGAGRVRYPELQLALGRIRSRDLKGWDRINALAKSVGITHDELIDLSSRASKPYTWNTPGYEIIDEVVDTLYLMARRGQNIAPIAAKLTLRPSQKLKIGIAKFSNTRQAEAIVELLASAPTDGDDQKNLADDLVGLGPAGVAVAFAKLQKMVDQPRLYTNSFSYKLVLTPVVVAKDRRALPLLEKMTGHDGRRTTVAMAAYFAITGSKMSLSR